MPRRKTNPEDAKSDPTFEQSLAGLESIVEAMEHEELPLEDLVAYYEKGSKLLDRCENLLQAARGRIELITLRNQDENRETPDSSPTSGDADSNDKDDIRLF